jgi:hypothetical protein
MPFGATNMASTWQGKNMLFQRKPFSDSRRANLKPLFYLIQAAVIGEGGP